MMQRCDYQITCHSAYNNSALRIMHNNVEKEAVVYFENLIDQLKSLDTLRFSIKLLYACTSSPSKHMFRDVLCYPAL